MLIASEITQMSHARTLKCAECSRVGHAAFFCRSSNTYVGHRKTAPIKTHSRKTPAIEVIEVKEEPIAVYAARIIMSHGLMRSPQILDRPFNAGKCIGEMRGGTRVDVYELIGEWARVLCEGQKGYVRVCREGETYLRRV